MYRVIHEFLDLKDGNHYYGVGDVYPRKGAKTTLERATELIGKNNKIGVPLIEEIAEEATEEKPKRKTTRK